MQLLSEALAAGATEAVMEVSSHALEQQRVFGIPFDVAVFSNLTRDHLDYHVTFENYFAAKRILFEGCGTEPPRCAILNLDDEYGRELLAFCRGRSSVVYSYGLDAGDFHARNLRMTAAGNCFQLVTPAGEIEIWSPLIGRVNVYNVIAACAAALRPALYCRTDHQRHLVGRSRSWQIRTRGCRPALRRRGRLRAHRRCAAEPDRAWRASSSPARLRPPATPRWPSRSPASAAAGRVITVFGCGGDRDRTKRPLMGKAAGEGSDFVVLTSTIRAAKIPRRSWPTPCPGFGRRRTRLRRATRPARGDPPGARRGARRRHRADRRQRP